MAWKQKELSEWLKTLGLPEEKLNVALGAIGDDAIAAKIGEGVMAQADYTRQTQTLKDKEKELLAGIQKKDREADAFRGELTTWKAGKEKEFNDAVTAKTALETQLATVRTSIKSLAGTYGIPDADLAPLMTTTPGAAPIVPARTDPQRDTDGKFLTREEAQNLPKVTLVMNGLARQHAQLFPNVPFDDVAIYDAALKNNRSLEAEWKDTFKVDDRRAELAKATHDSEIAAAEARGAESARSKLLAENPTIAIRVRQGDHQGSPILDRARQQAAAAADAIRKEGKAPVEVSEGRGVDAAVKAFNAGTYQGGVEKTA